MDDNKISGSLENIRSWHPGDPDIEQMEAWRREHKHELVAFYESRPKAQFNGQALLFGTGGDLDNQSNLSELFYKSEAYNIIEYPDGSTKGYFMPAFDPWSQD